MKFTISVEHTVTAASAKEAVAKLRKTVGRAAKIALVQPELSENVELSPKVKAFLETVYYYFEGAELDNPPLSAALSELENPLVYKRPPCSGTYGGKPVRGKGELTPETIKHYKQLQKEVQAIVDVIGPDVTTGKLLGIEQMDEVS